MHDIILDRDELLHFGMLKCPEVIELQNIFNLSKDGYFGIRTSEKLKKMYEIQFVKLSDLEKLGFEVRKTMPVSEIWWMEFKH